MTNAVLTWLENEWSKLKGETAVQTAVADVENIGGAGWAYIKNNALTDIYQIAMGVLTAAVPGASWTGILATVETQAVAAGKQLLTGATAVVTATAQADLIAAGKLLPPVASTTTPTAPAA